MNEPSPPPFLLLRCLILKHLVFQCYDTHRYSGVHYCSLTKEHLLPPPPTFGPLFVFLVFGQATPLLYMVVATNSSIHSPSSPPSLSFLSHCRTFIDALTSVHPCSSLLSLSLFLPLVVFCLQVYIHVLARNKYSMCVEKAIISITIATGFIRKYSKFFTVCVFTSA